jgi:hypothetical protein
VSEIKYTIIAEVDDVMVYRGEFEDIALLEESGLRKAEFAVEKELEEVENE